MQCEIWNTKPDEFMGYANLEPIHGEDFCEYCGDCLSCYGSDACFDYATNMTAGNHRFVRYIEASPTLLDPAKAYLEKIKNRNFDTNETIFIDGIDEDGRRFGSQEDTSFLDE